MAFSPSFCQAAILLFPFAFLSSHPPIFTTLFCTENYTNSQFQLPPSPHHTNFYPYHRKPHFRLNPLATMEDTNPYTQLPQALASTRQYPPEELMELPNYALPSIQEMAQPSAPVQSGHYYQEVQSALPQFALSVWDTERMVQPTAPVAYGNYNYQGGEQYASYAPPKANFGAWSTINAPGMMARTPAAISPAGIPSAAAAFHGYVAVAQTGAPQAHLPQQQQQRQQQPPAVVQDGHVCPIWSADWEDQIALASLCAYSREKGKPEESCAHVAAKGTSDAIRMWRNGNHQRAQSAFHRLASKNLNQKINRAREKRLKNAAKRSP